MSFDEARVIEFMACVKGNGRISKHVRNWVININVYMLSDF